MTDETEVPEEKTRKVTFSIEPIDETSESNSTITALVHNNPLKDRDGITSSEKTTHKRDRRRSSVSILQALAHSQLLTTPDARRRLKGFI